MCFIKETPLLRYFSLLPVLVLAACNDPEPEPVPAPTVAAPAAPALPAPDEELFSTLFAATCPAAEKVSVAVCKRAMGADNAICEFGVGEDEYLRHKATLEAGEGEWAIADAEEFCAEHDSHHVDT